MEQSFTVPKRRGDGGKAFERPDFRAKAPKVRWAETSLPEIDFQTKTDGRGTDFSDLAL